MGVDANAPYELVPVKAKRHRSFSLATVRESIGVLVVDRVFERSWLCAGHGASVADHSGGGRPTGPAASSAVALTAIAPAARSVATIRCAMRIFTSPAASAHGTESRALGSIGIVTLLALLIGASLPAGGDTSTGNGRIVFQASAGETRQLFTIRPDGSGLRQITRVASSGLDRGAEQPAWSPDGRRIAFDAPSGAGTALFTVRFDGSRLATVRLRLSGSSAAPAYSPDGRKLAFDHRGDASRPADGGIYVAGADGSRAHRVTTAIAASEAYDTAATWSPDGARLCFTRVRDAHEAALYVVGADGRGLRRLTPWALDASAAAWSPDGTTLVFESYSTPHAGRSANLFTISPDGTAMTQLTHFRGGAIHGFGPAWSPDGRQIVWHKLGPDVNQLFVMDSSGHDQRQLTHMPGNPKISHPDWG